MRVALVGCGRVGALRARVLAPSRLVAAADLDPSRAARLAADHAGCVATTDWRAAVDRNDVDLVAVATTNDVLATITRAAVDLRKHVLVEKPAARHAAELQPVRDAAHRAGVTVKVGFNLRFHPAVRRAHEIVDSGVLGEVLYVRARYGHGGRLGYEREWRADPLVAGGGQLLDQGVHLVDLARWFAGPVVDVAGRVATFFWERPVEDNAFLLLTTAEGRVAWLHTSCTEWKNLFSLEIFGRDGKVQVDGLGGSYGTERLTVYRMAPEMGPPGINVHEYPGEDLSWREEYRHFLECVATGRPPCGGLDDAIAALEVVARVYALAGRRATRPASSRSTSP